MPQVSVTIDGRKYRLACNEGEEARLESLAGLIDEKIGEMRKTFGEIGDQRLVIMAALTIADSLAEARDEAAASASAPRTPSSARAPSPRAWTNSARGSNWSSRGSRAAPRPDFPASTGGARSRPASARSMSAPARLAAACAASGRHRLSPDFLPLWLAGG